jgi:hypothetical protein
LRFIGNEKIMLFDVPRFHTASFIPSAHLKTDARAFPNHLHLFDPSSAQTTFR